jgi:pre-rRNA-processing protein IPI1
LERPRPRPTISQTLASSQSVGYKIFHLDVILYLGDLLTKTAIVVNQQSLSNDAPSLTKELHRYLEIASSSRSDTQRRDALSYLVNQFTSQPVNTPFPVRVFFLVKKLVPLLLDGSDSVRSQLLKLFRLLPASELVHDAEPIMLYIRAGLTHLAARIATDALAALEWLLEVAKDSTVSCPGGWFKTLKCFLLMLGWSTTDKSLGWTRSNSAFGAIGKAQGRQLLVFAQFLKAGLFDDRPPIEYGPGEGPPLYREAYMLSKTPNPYAHLNLFGSPRDEEGEMYMDTESRQRVFQKHFRAAVEAGIERVKKDAGEAGRSAAVLAKIVRDGMAGYSDVADTL